MLQDGINLEVESVNVKQFYGKANSLRVSEKSFTSGQFNRFQPVKQLPRRLSNLCGPSQVWRVFPKQKEALEYAKTKRSGLVTFAFQQSDGIRLFLVAHPQIFWHYDVQKNPNQRCSFEVIPEYSACKLYFDLEYDAKSNPSKRGSFIVNSLVILVLYFIQVVFNIKATRENVLDLDSSTHGKFSRHLIFQLDSHVFCNYQSVGEFVRFICQKLLLYLESCAESVGSNYQFSPDECKCCQSSSLNRDCVKGANISLRDLKELVVLDRKGNECLICDLSVYSKNRHFRLFQNTKWTKNAPLIISEDNTYRPILFTKDAPIDEITTEAFFLDSLVSYTGLSQTSPKEFFLINFVNPLPHFSSVSCHRDNVLFKTLSQVYPVSNLTSDNYVSKSPYPEVDDFISSVVSPGRIWRLAYFSSSNTIVYDIVGNRYCQNIKRQHRRNNVKYIVDLENCTYYQKCHDIDCSTFRSNPLLLPEDLKFQLNDDCNISDSDLNEVASVVEELSFNLSQEN